MICIRDAINIKYFYQSWFSTFKIRGFDWISSQFNASLPIKCDASKCESPKRIKGPGRCGQTEKNESIFF